MLVDRRLPNKYHNPSKPIKPASTIGAPPPPPPDDPPKTPPPAKPPSGASGRGAHGERGAGLEVGDFWAPDWPPDASDPAVPLVVPDVETVPRGLRRLSAAIVESLGLHPAPPLPGRPPDENELPDPSSWIWPVVGGGMSSTDGVLTGGS